MTVRELAIETKDLTCKFGDFTAVDRLNIKVYSGERQRQINKHPYAVRHFKTGRRNRHCAGVRCSERTGKS